MNFLPSATQILAVSFLQSATQILAFGTMGLSLLLSFLTFRLLQRALSQPKAPSKPLLAMIALFMGMNVAFALGAGYLELKKQSGGEDAGWGAQLGEHARISFARGRDTRSLNGLWEVTLYEKGADGVQRAYQYKDQVTGLMKDYPPEKIRVTTRGAVVSLKSEYSSGEGDDFWGEGRVSAGGDWTSIYWSPADGPERDIVGVNFLTISEVYGGPLTMDGNWIGRSRDGKVHEGSLKWKKLY